MPASSNLLANPRKLAAVLAFAYAMVGLVSLFKHEYYMAGFWWCIGSTQVLGVISKLQAPATQRRLKVVAAMGLAAGLILLGLYVRGN